MVKAQLIDIGFKASLKAFFEGLAKKGVRIKRQINNFVHRHGKDFRPLDILQKDSSQAGQLICRVYILSK